MPGFIDIKENEKANEPAKMGVKTTGITRHTEQFTSLANIKCTVTKRKSNKVKHMF